MGGTANIERQHAAGRLTVRERIDQLLDPGTFHEIGSLAGRATYDDSGQLTAFTPSNFVVGTGRLDARQVVVGGDDFTVRGGAADARVGNKMGHGEKLARGLRIPMVRLVDGTGGGGSVKTIEQIGRTYVPANPAWDTITAMLGEVPVVGACLGPVAGLGAVRVVTSHFSLMVRGSSQLLSRVHRWWSAAWARRLRKKNWAATRVTRAEVARWTTKSEARPRRFNLSAASFLICRRACGRGRLARNQTTIRKGVTKN